jgi:hypothetical protein
MAAGGGNPYDGAPRSVPGGPTSIPGAPQSVPGGPSAFSSFLTTVETKDTSKEFAQAHIKQIRDFSGRFAGPSGIAWQGLDGIAENLLSYGDHVAKGAEQAAEELKNEIVEYMKSNHPWDNRTGDAEAGLKGFVIINGDRIVIWFGHSVEYGIWLETMQNGAFAIILPTLLRYAPQLGARVAGHV